MADFDLLGSSALSTLPPVIQANIGIPTNIAFAQKIATHAYFARLENHIPKPRRVRTVTMDSEDAEELMTQTALVWEDPIPHSNKLLARLNTMRNAEKFCDVRLKVESRTIPAHRAVLACTSGYLFELFDSEDTGNTNYYHLDDLQADCVEILINYAYTSRLEVPQDMVKAVYKTATLLKMQEPAKACSDFLADNLCTFNCLATRSFANSNSDEELTYKTDNYIQNNINTIVNNQEMQCLPTIRIDIMGVGENELKDHGEKLLSKMVVDWLETALNERTFTALCEDRQVLYLTTDNNLHDCLELVAGDADQALSDLLGTSLIIQDYQKMGKRKKIGREDKPAGG